MKERQRQGIKIIDVQREFNAAIVRRDRMCVVRDGTPCSGILQCSHYYSVGANGVLRFFPDNANTMCAHHHAQYHAGKKKFYTDWYKQDPLREVSLELLDAFRWNTVRYTQPLLKEILRACREDRLYDVGLMILEILKGQDPVAFSDGEDCNDTDP